MKELTIEQKAQRYDEAIEGIQEILSSGEDYIKMSRLQLRLQGLFPELKEKRIKEDLIQWINEFPDTIWRGHYKKDVIAWLEKQGEQNLIMAKSPQLREQKPTDKVEPKFHEGDWSVSNLDGKARQISEIRFDEYNCYYVVDGKSVNLEEYDRLHHLWTIQDAKDGDVLAFKNNICGIIICKSPTDYDTRSYCRLACDNLINKEESGWDSTLLVPATKEQRDTLMKAMADAGWEFNFEKKELKKIERKTDDTQEVDFFGDFRNSDVDVEVDSNEDGLIAETMKYKSEQKHAWSEEDDNCLSIIIAEFSKCAGKSVSKDKWMHCNDFLNSLKDRIQPKVEWSALDERNLQGIIDEIEANKNQAPDYDIETYDRFLTWLKSLRPQKQWKPSKKQIVALRWILNNIPYNKHKEEISGLLDQIKEL